MLRKLGGYGCHPHFQLVAPRCNDCVEVTLLNRRDSHPHDAWTLVSGRTLHLDPSLCVSSFAARNCVPSEGPHTDDTVDHFPQVVCGGPLSGEVETGYASSCSTTSEPKGTE